MVLERILASIDRIEAAVDRPRREARTSQEPPWDLDPKTTLELVESMLLTRHLDALAQQLRAEGRGHYTIASAGHEANAVLGRLTRSADPSMVHYRSAAFQLERARAHPEVDAVGDIALSLVAAAADPLCSGRHKVLGSKRLGIIPQTSTIGSQLPRAIGLAFALERRARLLPAEAGPREDDEDAIALVSFGDASLNHSTTQGALNAASWVVHQRLKLPLLFVCEDNRLGISVQSPEGFVETRLRAQPHLEYFGAEGWRLDQTYRVAERALEFCRTTRRPAVLHMKCERLLGHAGSDVDTSYRSPAEIRVAEAHDPVLRAVEDALAAGAVEPGALRAIAVETRARVERARELARASPGLKSRAEIAAPLALPTLDRTPGYVDAPTDGRPVTLAQGINHGLHRIMSRVPHALVFGEDVARKGGVYGVTRGLLGAHGPARVFNTLLDEQTILGLGLGTATLGLLPIAEIQYLAYLHNAEDQLRGEAATLRFFSNGQYDNPMIVRVPGLAYQKGFGGHFHNDNALAVLRDVPGLVLGVPARADDACTMLNQAAALALDERRVVVLVEPIALYHQRDLHTEGDGLWLAEPSPDGGAFGRARVYHEEAEDLLIVTYGNGVQLSLRAARQLREDHGLRVRVLDLRWLMPLPMADVETHLQAVGRALVVDECRRTGSPSEEIMARLADRGRGADVRRIAAADCFVPLGEAAREVLVSEAEIVHAALETASPGPPSRT